MASIAGTIIFDDGRTRYLDFELYTSVSPFGKNVLSELDLRFDRLDDGLYMEISHHEPDDMKSLDKPSNEPLDSRGIRCYLVRDAYVQLLTSEEMEQLLRVTINGEDMLVRWQKSLIPIHHIRELSRIYLSDRDVSLFCLIAELGKILRREVRMDTANEDEDTIVAEKLGITSDILNHAFMVAEMQEQEDYE